MKKLLLLGKSFLLITVFLLSGCIKNEETDGVKALREAQASLIQAKADKESALIEAEVAYREAEAALKQAQADLQAAQARTAEAQSEQQIAIIKAETLALADKAVADAERALATSQAALEGALRDLEAEIALTTIENPTLDEYFAKYKATTGRIKTLQNNIINKQKEINEKNIALAFGGATQAVKNSLARNQRKLEKAEDKYEKYASANANPADIFEDVNAAEVAAKNIADEKAREESKKAELEKIVAIKAAAMSNFAEEYAELEELVDLVDDLTNTLGFTAKIDAIDYARLTNNPLAVDSVYKSIPKYVEEIDAAQEDLDDLAVEKANVQSVLSSVKALQNSYSSSLNLAQRARDNALNAYRNTVQAYNVALLANGGDVTNPAVSAAETAMNDALTEFSTKDTELTNLKGDIANAALDFGLAGAGLDEWDEKFYAWVGNNDEKIEALITNLEDNVIPDIDEDIAEAEEKKAELEESKAIVEAYIALLKTEYKATETSLTSVRNKFFAAEAEWIAAREAKEEQDDLISAINLEKAFIEAVKDALLGDYTVINTELEALEDAIKDLIVAVEADQKQIDEKDITDVEYLEGQISVLTIELGHLEQQLTVEQKLAGNYLNLINEELGS